MAKNILLGKDLKSLNVNSPTGEFLSNFIGKGGGNVKVDNINTGEPFVSLFPIREEVLASITGSMNEKGYDANQPIILWKEQNIVIDGHTRLQAAKIAGVETVPVLYASFETEEDVLDYMHRLQFNRRNITDADLIRLIMNALPKYEKKYGEGSKAEFLVKRFTGLSEGKAKKTLFVIENASDIKIRMVEAGQASINEVYRKLNKDKKTPIQKVRTNFFDEDDRQIIRCDEKGVFYFRDYEKKKERKAFVLPKFINRPELRDRIRQVIEEELGK